MEETTHGELYATARLVMATLGLDLPLTFYQAQDMAQMNAGLVFVPNEAHIVLQGPILKTMDQAELIALLGHELAHHAVLSMEDGTYRVAGDVIEAIAAHASAAPSHVMTALRMRLYTEITADRGSLLACGAKEPAIACLVKVHTGLPSVDAGAYLRQAGEVLRRGATACPAETHPDLFARALAIAAWEEKGGAAEAEICSMVQGPTSLDTLDVLDQADLSHDTRALLARILAPSWIRTPTVLAHARSFFADIEEQRSAPLAPNPRDPTVAEYFAYVLLDFAVADESLGDVGLAHALIEADSLGIGDVLERIARDELKMTKRSVQELRRQAPSLLMAAAAQKEDTCDQPRA